MIPNSDVPALLGNKTLKQRRALLDVAGKKLYFIGAGDYEIKLPPGSVTLNLEETDSGHLLLPITEFAAVSKSVSGRPDSHFGTPPTSSQDGQFPVVQQGATTAPTCAGISSALTCSGNPTGGSRGAEGRASVPTDTSRKVRFADARDPTLPCTPVPAGCTEPARTALRRACESSRGNAAGRPPWANGRAEAPTGSRGSDQAGHLPFDGRTVDELTPGTNSTFHSSCTDTFLTHLYDDENGIRQSALRDEQIRTHNIQLRHNYSHEHLRHQLIELGSQKPDLLWMRLAGCKTPRGDRHDHRQSRSLQTLINTQLDQQRHVIIEGNARDYAWDLPGLTDLRNDKRLFHSRHLWCNSGVVDPDTSYPVHRCTLVLTSFPLEDRSQCQCASPRTSSLVPRSRSTKDIMMLISFVVDLVRFFLPHFRAALSRPMLLSDCKEQGDVPESSVPDQSTTSPSKPSSSRSSSSKSRAPSTSTPTTMTTTTEERGGDAADSSHESFPTETRERQKEQWELKKTDGRGDGPEGREAAEATTLS